MNLSRYYHTLKYLKPVQIRYQLWYRIRYYWRKILKFQYQLSLPFKGYPLHFQPWIDKPTSLKQRTFTFLNQSISYNNSINWDESQNGKLWAYNLNYMDYLLQSETKAETGIKLIVKFIEDLSENQTGLEPYPVALRGINWIKFLSKFKIRNLKIDNSLYAQYRILLDNIEYHILGNHLLEDGFSLLFGAFYFQDEKFYRKSAKIINRELNEQILSDGAHFELSPMYHQTILDRLLDCINLTKNNQYFNGQENLLSLMTSNAIKMISWLNIITFPDCTFPLFNDAAIGIAPNTKQLLNYAGKLGLDCGKSIELSDSGYRKITTSKYECLIDIGQINPKYQPGHTHADTFNFHLHVDGKPVIVDTGTSTYNKCAQRQAERGTSAHNTVSINNSNSSDVWSGFRVGKRAKVLNIEEKYSDTTIITASHNGYSRLQATHQRTFECSQDNLIITDKLIGKSKIGDANLHFHPEVNNITVKNNMVLAGELCIEFINCIKIQKEIYHYHPSFNTSVKATKLIVAFEGVLITIITPQKR